MTSTILQCNGASEAAQVDGASLRHDFHSISIPPLNFISFIKSIALEMQLRFSVGVELGLELGVVLGQWLGLGIRNSAAGIQVV